MAVYQLDMTKNNAKGRVNFHSILWRSYKTCKVLQGTVRLYKKSLEEALETAARVILDLLANSGW